MKDLKVAIADYAMQTILANVDNDKLSDADFREFIRTFSASVSPKPNPTNTASKEQTQ
jgi:hypothetical protein